ncbi:MFS transporter [Sphingomonas sp.]|uniref:MFS transporter n=1 Tax=Sphingomonas sp. TaxID=28214 RepID=UPI0031DD2501
MAVQPHDPKGGEFARGWPVVLVAATGTGLGIAGLLTYTAGIFAKDLGPAIGLTRTALGLAFFLSTVMLAVAMPVVGRLVDRRGPRGVAVVGSLALSVGFLALGTVVRSSGGFIATMALIGLFAAGSAPVGYTRAVNAWFDRSRGLALGLTQLGIGLAGTIMPPVVALVVTASGWRTGYLVLSVVALVGVVPALALPAAGTDRSAVTSAVDGPPTDGRLFVALLLAFGAMALSFAGLLPHFVPMLRDAGMSGPDAGFVAALVGVSVIVSRVVVGWLADRISAPRIAAACCLLCAVGCAALAWQGVALAWAGAVALGSAMGAEADLIGYLTVRYFGIARYGRLYALQYASFMLMAGLSPLWIGVVADRSGSYAPPLVIAACGLVVAAILFMRLPSPPPSPRASA